MARKISIPEARVKADIHQINVIKKLDKQAALLLVELESLKQADPFSIHTRHLMVEVLKDAEHLVHMVLRGNRQIKLDSACLMQLHRSDNFLKRFVAKLFSPTRELFLASQRN